MTLLITAGRCRICAREFRVELGPEAHSTGRYLLSEHLLNDHTHEEVALVYSGAKRWHEITR